MEAPGQEVVLLSKVRRGNALHVAGRTRAHPLRSRIRARFSAGIAQSICKYRLLDCCVHMVLHLLEMCAVVYASFCHGKQASLALTLT